MFSSVLQELKGYFGRDYLLGVFFPVLLFVSANVALYLEVTTGLKTAVLQWDRLPVSVQVLIVLGSLTAVAVISYSIFNFQYVITRLFEGYWRHIPLLSQLRGPLTRYHRSRWQYLDQLQSVSPTQVVANEFSAEKLAYYPPPNHLDKMMPTLIGNILRASEIHAYDRYGIDSVIVWTRLRPLLPTEVEAAIGEKKIARDFSLLMSLLAGLFTLTWSPWLAIFTDRWGLFLICIFTWALVFISYHNAVQSTLAYAEQIKATFDVYRLRLLKELNREVPKNTEAERREWVRLSRFFYRNVPIPSNIESQTPDVWDRMALALVTFLEKECPPASGVDDKRAEGEE